jgi:hypothetical protein
MDHSSTGAVASPARPQGRSGQALPAHADMQTVLRSAPRVIALLPAVAALAYPFLLQGFHAAVGSAGTSPQPLHWAWPVLWLLAASSVPLIGIACAGQWSPASHPSRFDLRARRLACISIAAPPLYVFVGVSLGLSGVPLKDVYLWAAAWLMAGAYVWSGDTETPAASPEYTPALRVAHGVFAAIITLFVLFHLTNHIAGLLGPEVHAAVMRLGRHAYRSGLLEPVLVSVLLLQVFSGVWLVRYWTASATDRYRVLQIGSGVYLAAFVIAHLNSALVSARAIRGIETDWAWASGGTVGLIHDAWNIRLVPHYAFGVFFVLAHLCSGLRQVLHAHDVAAAVANGLWIAGVVAGAILSAAVMYALCGGRV